jgi:hypothetical protein
MKETREMRNDVIKIVPSILAADFARSGEHVAEARRACAGSAAGRDSPPDSELKVFEEERLCSLES